MGNLFDRDRNVIEDLHHRAFDILDFFDETDATNYIFNFVNFNCARPDIHIGHPDRGNNFFEFDIVGAHGVRVDIDLVFLDIPADRGHFTYSFRGHERVTDIPVLDTSQLGEVPSAGWIPLVVLPLERIPEDLAKRCRIGTERRLNPVRQRSRRKAAQLFKNTGARPVKFDVIFKNDIDGGKAENRITAYRFHSRYPEKRYGQRI